MNDSSGPEAAETNATAARRSFIEWLSLALGGLLTLAPLGIGLWSFCDPFRRRRSGPKWFAKDGESDEFIRITSLDALTVGGPPQRFKVVANRTNAWNFTPNQAIGAVFIERTGPQEIRVFHTTCPHAGCSVSFASGAYQCPCHNSSFNLDGSKLARAGKENPSPRDLDTLEVDAERLADGEVWIKYEDYYTGRHEKIAKA